MFRFFLMVMVFCVCMGWEATASAGEESALRQVRVIYLVSSDRKVDPAYTAALDSGIRELQKWYGKQLDGPTFRLHDPVVEIVHSRRPAKWFYANPNGNNKDDWGFNNTQDEVKRIFGKRFNTKQFDWIIYSDGPGNKGRACGGVACLPEDDLLGLVGKHPAQKNPLRWIGGMGHELGHSFGLPHPADTKKNADAIMWTGMYDKYPDKAYLTEDDKKILMRSPFFYYENNKPVFELGKVIARYPYDGGAFEQHAGSPPICWTERKSNANEDCCTFEETERDAGHIVLYDSSRGFTIRLPVSGGMSELSTNNGKTWQPLYRIKRPMFRR